MAEIFITYQSETRLHPDDGAQTITTTPLSALSSLKLRAGDHVRFLPGSYWPPIAALDADSLAATPTPIRLTGLRGEADAPIRISGLGDKTRIIGASSATPTYPDLPEARHYAFFQLIDCAHVEIADFDVQSCWPSFIYLEDASHITVRRIKAVDSIYLIFARQSGDGVTHRILVEDCDWEQDPTGTLWDALDWAEVHHGRYAFLNGGLFGATGIGGQVVIRGNRVKNAYNAVRIIGRPGRAGYDVEVTGNRFERIRDNVTEPERFGENWQIANNHITDAHAWFSADGALGGWRHILGNTGHFTDQPSEAYDGNRGGKVLKFDKKVPAGAADRMSTIAHNSFNIRSHYAKKKSVVFGLRHRNNIITFCQGGDAGICGARPTLTKDFMKEDIPPSVSFDWDEITQLFRNDKDGLHADQERNGRDASPIQFTDPGAGDFTTTTPPLNAPPLVFQAGVDWPADHDWTLPDGAVGALTSTGAPYAPPPFFESQAFGALPRITAVARAGRKVTLYLSRNVAEDPIPMRVAGGAAVAARFEGRALIADFAEEIADDAALEIVSAPSKAPLTLWACPDPLIGWGAPSSAGV